MNSRSENAKAIARAPLMVLRIVLTVAWIVVTVPALLAVIFMTLAPAELCWALSPFVGIVSPAVGHRLASHMEPAGDRLVAAIDLLWKPLDLLDP